MIEENYVNWGDALVTFLIYGALILFVVLLLRLVSKKKKKNILLR